MDKLVLIVGVALLANTKSPLAYHYGWHNTDENWDDTQEEWPDHKQGRQHHHDQGWHHNPNHERHNSHERLHNAQEGWQKPNEECHQSHEGWQNPHQEYGVPDSYESHESHHGNHGLQPDKQNHWSINENENIDYNHDKRAPIQFPEEINGGAANPFDVVECMYYCPLSKDVEPVCGTNSFTYGNMDKLECARKCGVEVDFAHWGFCTNPDIELPNTSTTTTVAPSDIRVIRQCLHSCPTTSEYNPVCGTNFVMYDNFGKLECAWICGIKVKLLRQGSCPQLTQSPGSTDFPPIQPLVPGDQSVSDQQIQQCIRSCRVTSEYYPVCGSNMVQYNNIGKLQCAKNCGINVSFVQFGNCPNSLPTVETTTTPPTITVPPELSFDVRNNEEMPAS